MKTSIHTLLVACLACAGCISPRPSTTAVLRETIIPRISFRQAIAADVVEFFQSAYEEYRQSDDPDLHFVAGAQLRATTVGGPMKTDPKSMVIDEGMTATAPLWEEMQRFAQLAELDIAVDGHTITFTIKQGTANKALHGSTESRAEASSSAP